MYVPYETSNTNYNYDFDGPKVTGNKSKDDLVERIRQAREHLSYLKERLALEKENLQMEIVASKHLCDQFNPNLETTNQTSYQSEVYKPQGEASLQYSSPMANQPQNNWQNSSIDANVNYEQYTLHGEGKYNNTQLDIKATNAYPAQPSYNAPQNAMQPENYNQHFLNNQPAYIQQKPEQQTTKYNAYPQTYYNWDLNQNSCRPVDNSGYSTLNAGYNHNNSVYNNNSGYPTNVSGYPNNNSYNIGLENQYISSPADDYFKRLARDATIYSRAKIYRGQLETVEKECDFELNRMQDSISSIRNMRKYWEKFNSSVPANTSSVPDYYLDPYFYKRKHRSHSEQKKRPSSAKQSRHSSHPRKHDRSKSRTKEATYIYPDMTAGHGRDYYNYY